MDHCDVCGVLYIQNTHTLKIALPFAELKLDLKVLAALKMKIRIKDGGNTCAIDLKSSHLEKKEKRLKSKRMLHRILQGYSSLFLQHFILLTEEDLAHSYNTKF